MKNTNNNTNKNNQSMETKVVCPVCGAEFALPEHEQIVVGVSVGKDSGLGVIELPLAGQCGITPLEKAKQRRQALADAGVDVSGIFAMQDGSLGHITSDGDTVAYEENDPIFQAIMGGGTIPERRLFRRWIMSQMFHMQLAHPFMKHDVDPFTQHIGYFNNTYVWKMTCEEFKRQAKMQKTDPENFAECNKVFNLNLLQSMIDNEIEQLEEYIETRPVKKCKGLPYKKIGGRDIFCSDIALKILLPWRKLQYDVRKLVNQNTNDAKKTYQLALRCKNLHFERRSSDKKSKEWIDAYKWTGAYFTMKNLILFHDCTFVSDNGRRLTKYNSMQHLIKKGNEYAEEGWRLYALLKDFMYNQNNIDVTEKINEWAAKKQRR